MYPKDTGLTKAGADAALAVMTHVFARLDAEDFTPAVINLRASERHVLRKGTKIDPLRHYARSEAETFIHLWNSASPAA